MALKNIAVDGWEWEFNSGSGTVTTTDGLTNKLKCDGKQSFEEKVAFAITGYSGQGIAEGTGAGEIKGSSEKFKLNGKSVVLEEDESEDITVTGINQAPPPPVKSVTVKVKVKKAGQTKVKTK